MTGVYAPPFGDNPIRRAFFYLSQTMLIPESISENIDMKLRTSFRAGGVARFFSKPDSVEELISAKNFARENGLPYFLLGRGSNVVVSDSGFNGLVIQLGKGFSQFKFDGESLKAMAAAPLSLLARTSATLGLSGIHLLAGIPGSIGGAVTMNAGAYGQEISGTLQSVEFLDEDDSTGKLSAEACGLGYRKSIFRSSPRIILSATFSLSKESPEALLSAQKKILEERKAKQPLELPSAGSMFKRPANGFPGALIESAGLKGYRIGGAEVSPKHANFIINNGNASAEDIYKLSEYVKAKVFENSGIELEREVIFLGDF